MVRFTAGSTSVDVTIGEDNPTVRDFLSLLPLTMKLQEYAGREKIGYFSRKLVAKQVQPTVILQDLVIGCGWA